MVKVRFAPSPSGSLHIGSARTAIVNYLFAKSQGGELLLRIEDTDSARSSQESKDIILSTLTWLGISWNEGPFYQSDRLTIYQKQTDALLRSGKAYRCFCSQENGHSSLDNQSSENFYNVYDGRCAKLSEDEIQKRLEAKYPFVVRLKMPSREISFTDLLKGSLSFQGDLLSDIILTRNDGSPTYNFAVVVDDHMMNITHVIRGEDHLSNTPKQIAIYDAFGWEHPRFCHLPLIIGADKAKLSKRHGDTAIEDYQKKGFLPEAIFCYLSLLGYSRKPTKEIFEQKTLVDQFQLIQLSCSASQFDITNLTWMNAQFIKKSDPETLWILAQKWLSSIPIEIQKKKKIFFLSINQMKTFNDLPEIFEPFQTYRLHKEDPSVQKLLQDSEMMIYLEQFFQKIDLLQPFEVKDIEILFETYLFDYSINKRNFAQLIRLVLIGSLISPSLFDTFVLLGKAEVMNRFSMFKSEIKK
jgi:glutamyl-tRNA synthetase